MPAEGNAGVSPSLPLSSRTHLVLVNNKGYIMSFFSALLQYH